jgi:phosphoglycerol transferase MdoB-like AlkP superfamily enzyme
MLVISLTLPLLSRVAAADNAHQGLLFGYKRIIGGEIGVALVLLGIVWIAAPRRITRDHLPWLAAIYVTFSAWLLTRAVPDAEFLRAARWVLLAYAIAICLLIPLRFGVIALVAIFGLDASLEYISTLKIALLGLPLTALDIKVAAANPGGLWNALGIPHWTLYLAMAAAAMTILFAAVITLRAAHRYAMSRPIRRDGYGLVARLLVACLVVLVAQAYLSSLYARISIHEDTWDPVGVSKLYHELGVPAFLAYSHHIEMTATGDFYSQSFAEEPGTDDLRDAVVQYIDFGSDRDVTPAAYPNMVMLLAESTFDVGKIFRVQGDLNEELFVPNEYTVTTGPLFVNTIGGGTWITEFETIVGLDSRIFGYSGYYTHSSLSPYVERSLATYLRERGYFTSAWFPHEGDFYNARRAYEHYGFQRIVDSYDAGRGNGWGQTDVGVIEDFMRMMGPTPQAPFFSYVLLIENHAPHVCHVTAADFRVHLTDTDEFEPNCALHEYLRRLDATTAAFDMLLHYLIDIQTRTGRPFVLAVLGDHQPHTFTSTGGMQYDFSPFRKGDNKSITFFHILSTASTKLKLTSVPPPATLLPTLLSGFVAKGPEDVYLGLNLWLYRYCGSDAVGREYRGGFNSMDSVAEGGLTATCRSAYDRALAGYRKAGVFRLSFSERERQSRRSAN